jgi:DNA-directed RNA polymerase specialized sigma24 family protein
VKLPTLGDDSDTRLSQIPTQWMMLAQAQGASQTAATGAWCALMHRYCGAVYRYLAGAVRDEDVALELFQEFAMRFLRGDFRRADPAKGRFRDYVRTALIHLVTDHYRQIQNLPRPLPDDLIDPAVVPLEAANCGDEFVASWRDELIDRTWRAIAQSQPSYHALLMLHVRQPGISAAELAGELSKELQRPIHATNARVMLHRARHRFAELLVREVEVSLEGPSQDELDEELKALGLWSICQPVMISQQQVERHAEGQI